MDDTSLNPVLPTLHSSVGFLRSRSDVIAYTLRQVTACPGMSSRLYEEEMLSMRKLESRHGENREMLCQQLAEGLKAIFYRYFPQEDISTECTPTTVDEVRYNIDIRVSITDSAGTHPALTTAKIQKTDKNTFTIHFEGV